MKNTMRYIGRVKIDTMKKGRRIHSVTHNTGLPDMAWMFSKAITGNLNQSTDVPRSLDLGYIIPGTGGIWTSILNKPVHIGGRQYSFDGNELNWVGTLIATIYYSDINGGLLDQVISQAKSGSIQLKLRLCSYQAANRKYFAEVDISPEDVVRIKELTSAIITWYSEIVTEVTDELDTLSEIDPDNTIDDQTNSSEL